MCKSDFGEEFPIFIMLEGLFRRAVRSEAAPNARNHWLQSYRARGATHSTRAREDSRISGDSARQGKLHRQRCYPNLFGQNRTVGVRLFARIAQSADSVQVRLKR
jgi:hypothetical protein